MNKTKKRKVAYRYASPYKEMDMNANYLYNIDKGEKKKKSHSVYATPNTIKIR